MLEDTIAQLNTISKLKITRGFAVSAKSGHGIKELRKALLTMVPARAVPLSYETFLDELRKESAKSKQPFLMVKDAEKLALTDEVRVSLCLASNPPIYARSYWVHSGSCAHNCAWACKQPLKLV